MFLAGSLYLEKGEFSLNANDFKIPLHGVTAIFGHSGSGKTTLLRCLAGFEPKVIGRIQFGKRTWLNVQKKTIVPTYQRRLGYVFQESSLFPHLNVQQNLEYGLNRILKSTNIKISLDQVVQWLELKNLLKRMPSTLSGGERQRVAIATVLLSQPKILMMDEPLASLDLVAKANILPYIEKLSAKFDIPILYVTHSPDELVRIADRVLFMQAGKIVTLKKIQSALMDVNSPLYTVSEPCSIIKSTVIEHDMVNCLTSVKTSEQLLWVPLMKQLIGEEVSILVGAQNVTLMKNIPKDTSSLNILPVKIIKQEEFKQSYIVVSLQMQDNQTVFLSKITKLSANLLNLQIGMELYAGIKSASIL